MWIQIGSATPSLYRKCGTEVPGIHENNQEGWVLCFKINQSIDEVNIYNVV
jgi:hypothetical protein